MKSVFIPLIGAVLLGSGLATAQSKWPKEPETVFGVKVGGKIDGGTIISCTKLYETPDWERKPCYQRKGNFYSDTELEIMHLPFGDVYSGTITLDQGDVRSVSFELKTTQFQQIFEIFQERYGKPSAIENIKVSNLAGAVLPSRTVRWTGKKISIALFERLGTVDQAMAIISSNQINRKLEDASLAKRKAAASKM